MIIIKIVSLKKMGDTSLEKLLDIKITQIQLVRDRGYVITEQDKEILKHYLSDDEILQRYITNEEYLRYLDQKEENPQRYDEDNITYFYDYLKTLGGNPEQADYWIKRGFLLPKAIDYLGATLNNYVSKTLKPLLIKPSEHKLNWYQYWNDDYSKSMLVYYDIKGNTQVSNTTVKTFKAIIDEAELLYSKIRKTSPYNKIMEAILIADAKLSPEANKEMHDIVRGQMFLETELTYNPTLSIDNQIHTLVPKNDVKALLQSLRADKHGLETFKVNDPTIKYYGWKEGDIIKVRRTDIGVNILSPDSVNYKLVTI